MNNIELRNIRMKQREAEMQLRKSKLENKQVIDGNKE